jgi:hypothetical protein
MIKVVPCTLDRHGSIDGDHSPAAFVFGVKGAAFADLGDMAALRTAEFPFDVAVSGLNEGESTFKRLSSHKKSTRSAYEQVSSQ